MDKIETTHIMQVWNYSLFLSASIWTKDTVHGIG